MDSFFKLLFLSGVPEDGVHSNTIVDVVGYVNRIFVSMHALRWMSICTSKQTRECSVRHHIQHSWKPVTMCTSILHS